MAMVFRDWLVSTEMLPLEGMGRLQCLRRPAYLNETDGTIYPAQWSVDFTADTATTTDPAFFERLACFSRLPVAELKNKYAFWLQALINQEQEADVFGLGTLSKNDRSGWNWSAVPLNPLPEETAAAIPVLVSTPASDKRWDLGVWLIAAVTIAAAGYIGWLARVEGCSPAITTSKIRTELAPPALDLLPYREIR